MSSLTHSLPLCLLPAVLSLLFLICLPSPSLAAVCPSLISSGSLHNKTYKHSYTFLADQVKLTDITVNVTQRVESLQLEVGSAVDGPAQDFQVVLGLYQLLGGSFSLLTSTAPILVSASETSTRQTLTGAVLTSVTISSGVYHVARLVNASGLVVYGDGLPLGEGEAYPFNTALPSTVSATFTTTEVRAGILGCAASVTGDPVFVGFLGQVYQVHGLAGEIFNLVTSAQLQLNALFTFLGKGQAMSAEQQLEVQLTSPHRTPLPLTAAWSHPGTYLGSIGLQVGAHTLTFVPGPYATGFASIHLDGSPITKSGWVIHTHHTRDPTTTTPTPTPTTPLLEVRVIGWSRVIVHTAELTFHLVNSDGFLNIDSAELHFRPDAAHPIDGVLGQSADPTRFFPQFEPSRPVAADVKSDFQRHMIFDYLILDGELTSVEFQANLFRKGRKEVKEVQAEEEGAGGKAEDTAEDMESEREAAVDGR